MRIAFLSVNDPLLPEIDSAGGAVIVKYYAENLAKLGHNIIFYTIRIPRANYESKYFDLKSQAQKSNRVRLSKNITVIRKQIKLADCRIDHIAKTPFLAEITDAFSFANSFGESELDSFDQVLIFHIRTSFGFITKNLKAKVVLFPFLLSDEYSKYLKIPQFYKNLECEILNRADFVCALSEFEKKQITAKGINPKKIGIAHGGYDPHFFPFRRRKAISPNKPLVIACVGAVRKQKNQKLLLGIAQKMKSRGLDFIFMIIGEDARLRQYFNIDYATSIKQKIRALRLESHFHFTGGVTQGDMGKLLRIADLAVFPSIAESFGLAVLECISSGLPTIACINIPAYNEFATHGRNILLAKPTAEDFNRAINLFTKEPRLYSRLSSEGMVPRKKFTWERVSQAKKAGKNSQIGSSQR